MRYRWRVETATLAAPQPSYEPPQLEDVLNRLERKGWEVYAVIPEPASRKDDIDVPVPPGFNRARVVARKPVLGQARQTWQEIKASMSRLVGGR